MLIQLLLQRLFLEVEKRHIKSLLVNSPFGRGPGRSTLPKAGGLQGHALYAWQAEDAT